MNLFQWLSITFLAGLLAWEITWFARGRVLRGPWIVRCCVWLTAALLIAYPQLAQDVATAVGINRGTDLLLYVFVLGFLALAFYVYSRYVKLQRELTEVVRHVAVREARRGSGAALNSHGATTDGP
jgi:hypothetical protein